MPKKSTGSSQRTPPPSRRCPQCGHSGMESRRSDVRLVVDGQVEVTQVSMHLCASCGQETLAGDELRRAEKEIRARRGNVPAYSGKLVARIGAELHEALARSAELHHRSLNQQLIALLWSALRGAEGDEHADQMKNVVGLPTTRQATRKR